ncbi:hypothetical protein C6366_01980 [Desulfonatronum sp. SC1]|nr:hypothetical protein C6366_01980 [Desulfonatronum sp. SC1]
MAFEPGAGTTEHFAFEEQAADIASSPHKKSLIHAETPPPVTNPELSLAEDIPPVSEEIAAASVAASSQENFEVAPLDTRIELDVTEDISLEAAPPHVEVVSAEEADAAITGHADDAKPGFSKGAETNEESLPVWEIELPQDLLPQDFFPEPVGEERDPMEKNGGNEPEAFEVAGDIAYDFSEVEVIVPEPGEKDQSTSSSDTASDEAADREGAEGPSSSPFSRDDKEGR